MREIMIKELRLSASALSYLFIAFGLMFFVPGYPILCGVFFVTLGIFQSFQSAREANDILFSALLPFAKRDVVKGKYLFVCFIELCSLLVMGIAVIIRMTLLSGSAVYRSIALMNANPFALGMAFFIFALFNEEFGALNVFPIKEGYGVVDLEIVREIVVNKFAGRLGSGGRCIAVPGGFGIALRLGTGSEGCCKHEYGNDRRKCFGNPVHDRFLSDYIFYYFNYTAFECLCQQSAA